MQRIDRILKIDGGIGSWSDEWGSNGDVPEIMIGVRTQLVIDLRSSIKDSIEDKLLPFEFDFEYDSCYFVLDADYDKATIPRMHKTNGITITSNDEKTQLIAELPYTATPELMAALATNQGITLNGEIALYKVDDGVACVDFAVQFTLSIRNRIFLGGEVPEDVVEDPMYLTASEVKALIAEATRPEKGEAGKSAYEIAVSHGFEGTEVEWLAAFKGEAGKSAYEIAVSHGFEGTEVEWLEEQTGTVGAQGAPGDNAYQIALSNGFIGPVDDWLESLRGKEGQALQPDATGYDLDALAGYADRPEGFLFAYSSIELEKKRTTLHLYAKKSNDYNDWCDPVDICFFEKVAEVVPLEPLEFKANANDNAYLIVNLSDYPSATVAAVCIDTDDGEQTLPLGLANGVRKIVKGLDNKTLIYFGASVPEHETGRVYLTQFLGLKEATPSGIPEAQPIIYGYLDDDATISVRSLSEESLKNAKVKTLDHLVADERFAIEGIPVGAVFFVLIPEGASLKSYKDNGFYEKVAFDNGTSVPNSGANGEYTVKINNITYAIYGEFNTIAGDSFVHIVIDDSQVEGE